MVSKGLSDCGILTEIFIAAEYCATSGDSPNLVELIFKLAA